ncbi:hypothetical protein AURANDRAFT_62239 [Aureococcus anophagefferens]|uniref:Uncharacterized protein n=1 Tax=Aureococcus anophagefferens TaxID=44056 RepID=F0Y147_AURAN|nr:hypothetical protein AURANDRAFT_62239 [Aureococcus anophagefferens]EGB11003.1 hypothetical protein AURANDRAFT_62239 [Aureococcus anophagefferens]|eukprot:XP_009034563.1 hypothetical protein AURANDRAFT_62239 [Aureococcus anophagefferens]
MLIHLEDEDDEADRTAGNECWTCPTCTFTNVREAGAGDFGTCSVCESPRPEEADVFVASPRALEFDAPSPAKQRRGSGIFKRSAGADRLAALLSMDIDGGDPSPAENAWADVATKTPDDAADAVPGDLMEDEDAQIAYGVAVSLLVSGLAKKDLAAALVDNRAGQESEIPNFKGSDLGRFPLVSADFWTSDHLSERSTRAGATSSRGASPRTSTRSART